MSYKHSEIEPKWQKIWEDQDVFKSNLDKNKPKFYILDMFPYPSSTGLHVGHPEGYTATDIVTRYKRAKGFNVLHPMGWDAFGLPAEQYAIKTGVHPEVTTQKAIDSFRRQLKSLGFSYDWSREVSTADPQYFKWTQWIFLKLYEKGLAYQKEVPVNWCPALKTVLANEEVIDGKSERGGHPVIKIPMKQWMLKITSYAERLLADLDKVDWPERTKEGQRNWIGKSEGAQIVFSVIDSEEQIEVFTTRPDTIFGATFIVLAPEHPIVKKISIQKSKVEKYIQETASRSDIDRQVAKDKTGVFTGTYVLNPFTHKQIPIWVADYVMMGYGTGAIMAVPGHDERDFAFAKKFDLPIIRVIQNDGNLPYDGDGKMINSDFLDGIKNKNEAIKKVIDEIQKRKIGSGTTQYKLRDWLFSRQRFWGEPFPIVHFPNNEIHTVPLDELPVLLPKIADYEPSDKAESPLARNTEWLNHNGGRRETDTMPGSAGSSWYFLRYTDPQNSKEPFSYEAQKYWMPVDLYIGGAEHTVGHLLYSRFWQKVLFDIGLVTHDEPFKKLIHQGMILGADGEKMSKSRGNVINPDIVIEKHGADALRMYEMFMGPLDRDKPWSDQGIEGVRRFLDRVWRLYFDESQNTLVKLTDQLSPSTEKLLHKTIKKVTDDIESLCFNTAISQMMILTNELYKTNERPTELLKTLAQLLMPFAPHLAEEMWHALGGKGLVSMSSWPQYNPALCEDETIEMGVQVLGKTRGNIQISKTATQEEALAVAQKIKAIENALYGKKITKVIYKPGKILNIIVS